MASHLTSRLLFASGFALAIAMSPSAADHVVAAPSTCTLTQTGGSASIACLPGQTSGGMTSGAPSEQDITAKNAQRSNRGIL
jgi:hypothetical protein